MVEKRFNDLKTQIFSTHLYYVVTINTKGLTVQNKAKMKTEQSCFSFTGCPVRDSP